MNARVIAVQTLTDVIESKQHLDKSLSQYLSTATDIKDKKLAQEICYGTMRWYFRLTNIINLLLDKPLRKKDTDVFVLILSGLYQMIFMRIPDHAAISATVETARAINKAWATELVNAILRRYQREKDIIINETTKTESALHSHPQWLLEKLYQQWPEHWEGIVKSNNEHPPLHLRANLLKKPLNQYIELLNNASIDAVPADFIDTGILIKQPVNVDDIPGFCEGEFSVQDFGAQLAAPLLEILPGHRVLDACAAPGGKTGHIYENEPQVAELVSVESEGKRVKLLQDTVNRLGIKSEIIHADISHTNSWWDGTAFDRILIDSPCSATGVIRRHPDIKYLRVPEHIDSLLITQQKILQSVWPLLRPGGRLVYVTCSILKEECDNQIEMFTTKNTDVMMAPIDADWGIASRFGRYTVPGHDESDGFYYSVLIKRP